MLITINIPNEMFLQNSLLVERAVKLKTAREISSSVLPCTNLGTAHNDAFTSRDIMNVARLIAEVTITIMTMKNSKREREIFWILGTTIIHSYCFDIYASLHRKGSIIYFLLRYTLRVEILLLMWPDHW